MPTINVSHSNAPKSAGFCCCAPAHSVNGENLKRNSGKEEKVITTEVELSCVVDTDPAFHYEDLGDFDNETERGHHRPVDVGAGDEAG